MTIVTSLPKGARRTRDDMTSTKPNAPIYLDYQATTPTDPRVVQAMLPYFTEKFGNPHSTGHVFGRESEAAVEAARAQVAALIGADPREIVFTSGATESNNLALKGLFHFNREHGIERDHLVTTTIEHKCVLETAHRLEAEGFKVTFLPVERDGLVDLQRLDGAITERTALVSVIAAHNEIGVVQPLKDIGALCRDRGTRFHTDAAQAVGKISIDVNTMAIDMLSISGHKIYGPKGIGALFVRRTPRVRLTPLMDGGGQERGFRSGTLAPPLCVGLGEACAIAGGEMAEEATRLAGLRDRLLAQLRKKVSGVHVNGHPTRRLPGNLNVSFEGIDGPGLLVGLNDIAVSAGSACSSAAIAPSYVLTALGVPDGLAFASLRIGLGRFTTEAEIDIAVQRIAEEVARLRAGGPPIPLRAAAS